MEFKEVIYGGVACVVCIRGGITYINLSKFKTYRDSVSHFLHSLRGKYIVHSFKYKNGLEHEPWESYRQSIHCNKDKHEYNVVIRQMCGPNKYKGTYFREELAHTAIKYINPFISFADTESQPMKVDEVVIWKPTIRY